MFRSRGVLLSLTRPLLLRPVVSPASRAPRIDFTPRRNVIHSLSLGARSLARSREIKGVLPKEPVRPIEFSPELLFPGSAACSNRRSFNRISLVSVPVGIPPSRPHCVPGSSVPYSANRREFRVAELELGLRLDYQDGGRVHRLSLSALRRPSVGLSAFHVWIVAFRGRERSCT